MSLLHIGGGSGSSVVAPEGVDFDGTNDYLSRSSDLVGNVDSKTFTFSCWVYVTQQVKNSYTAIIRFTDGGTENIVFQQSGGSFSFGFNNTDLTANGVIRFTFPTSIIPNETWVCVVYSADVTDINKRHLFIGDTKITPSYSQYNNLSIGFICNNYYIGSANTSTINYKGRLAHVFLDYTYRDLSIEANRRLFITADGKPTPTGTLKALNPILYLPMKDNATAHINEGTGGNFTLNGTIATSERGANQDNCVASVMLDSPEQYIRNSITPSNSQQFTLSFNVKRLISNVTAAPFCIYGDTTNYLWANLETNTLFIRGNFNSSISVMFLALSTNFIATGINYSLQISVDTTKVVNTDKVKVFLNGFEKKASGYPPQDLNMNFSSMTTFRINEHYTGASKGEGEYGELYFDTTYMDLATNNPFWDKDTNKPIPVRKVIANTGVTPLIAMPLDASNAGKNYGTGGDFTANSSPYVGARGASEFWQRTAKFDGSTSYLSSTGLTGISDSKYLTIVANVYKTAATLYHLVGSTNSNVSIYINTSNQLVITAKNTAGTTILSATVTTTIANTTWTTILISIDLTSSSNRAVYLNGVSATVTWTTYTNDSIDFTNALWTVGADVSFANKFNGSMSLLLDNTYNDFTSETNRLKYIDGLGYPTDLNKKVIDGIITKPALYLDFSDTSNFGKNSGYGGNFTVNGTVTSGADVLG